MSVGITKYQSMIYSPNWRYTSSTTTCSVQKFYSSHVSQSLRRCRRELLIIELYSTVIKVQAPGKFF